MGDCLLRSATPRRQSPRRWRVRWVALLAGLLPACSLLSGTEGLSGGDEAAGAAGASVGRGGEGGGAGSAQAGGGGSGGAPAGGAGQGGVSGGGGQGGGAGGVPVDREALMRDCVLLLNMNEPAWMGQGAVTDESGLSNHGTAINNAKPTTDGKMGSAGLFDGNSWVEVPSSDSLGGAMTELTAAAWVYPDKILASGSGVIVKRESFELNSAFALFLWESNQVYADIGDARFHSIVSVQTGQWHHVAVVYNGQHPDPARRAVLYVDGKPDAVSTAASTIEANAQTLRVGSLPNVPVLPDGEGIEGTFYGRIDQAMVWARALGDDEIDALFRLQQPLPPPSD